MTQEDKQLLTIDLCGRLPYGVRIENYPYPALGIIENRLPENRHIGWLIGIQHKYTDITLEIQNVNDQGHKFDVSTRIIIEDAKPVLRDMSQLTEEITQANYNDGKPFVPILKLYEAIGGTIRNKEMSYRNTKFDGHGFGSVLFEGDIKVFEADSYRKWAGNYPVNFTRKQGMNITNTWQLYDLLNQWMFNWRNLPADLWINDKSLNERVY